LGAAGQPAFYPDQLNLGLTISISDTQIVFTNLLPGTPENAFGQLGSEIDGFDFKFSVIPANFATPIPPDILGVSVDPASAPDFLPRSVQLISPAEIIVDLSGADPALNNQLILDLSFPTDSVTAVVPEPSSMALLGAGLLALVISGGASSSRTLPKGGVIAPSFSACSGGLWVVVSSLIRKSHFKGHGARNPLAAILYS
jgi:hypothetical protein